MKRLRFLFLVILTAYASGAVAQSGYSTTQAVEGRWSQERINEWYAELPWLVGCNYYPATAINQIDMWQKSTWDPKQIKKELDWAQDLGMNTLRVFLHDMVWADDEKGFYRRMDQFLDICAERGIRPWFVFFDDCHYPNPKLGVQPKPVREFHNSGWVNCPARDVAMRYAKGEASEAEVAQLKGYVQRTMARFANDERVLMWEMYNEPGRGNGENGDMGDSAVPTNIGDQSAQLIFDSWGWAREVNPSQPITSCTRGSVGKNNIAINHINSDLFSIHSYQAPDALREHITEYKAEGRPIIVTEWLARGGSTPQKCLPVMKEMGVGAVNWGFVSGKSATIWSWKSRLKDGVTRNLNQERADGNVVEEGEAFPEPAVWFHDLYRMDGTPYDQAEIDTFKELTKGNKKF